MARMHSRRKGISGSTRPFRTDAPSWVSITEDETADIALKLHNQGKSTALIGLILRDSYGIPDVKKVYGKSITAILKEKGVTFSLPEDMENLMRKAIVVNEHIKLNKKDVHNKRNFHLIEAKIRRLERYYKNTGVLPTTWSYSISKAKLLIE
jgi:small subunit ribosomal protein S15